MLLPPHPTKAMTTMAKSPHVPGGNWTVIRPPEFKGGYQGPTSAPSRPPTGGSSVKPPPKGTK